MILQKILGHRGSIDLLSEIALDRLNFSAFDPMNCLAQSNK
jgi:hypothetical protein